MDQSAVSGWQATISQLARFHCDRPLGDVEPGKGIVDAVDEAVRHAAAGLVIPMRCVERAIAAHQILRAGFGQPATLVVCYRPCPRGFQLLRCVPRASSHRHSESSCNVPPGRLFRLANRRKENETGI